MGLFRTLRRGATWLSLGAAAGAVAVTVRHVLETPQPLENALAGEGHIDQKHGGDIYYNLSGPEEALPLVLLHDFYTGASNFEFRAIFPQLARRYRVYAPDWLGFGMSEHPAVAYTGEFYAGMLSGFLRDVIGRPAVVLAHGRAANIAVRAASDTPELFERVILVAPEVFAGVLDEPTLAQTLLRASRRVSLGIMPYAMLSTRPVLRWLSSTRSQRAREGVPDDETVERLYANAHQAGGQFATLAALTGDLDLAMPNAFAMLEPPVLLVSGEHDRRHPRVDMEDIAVLNPHADLDVVPDAGDSVFMDQPDAFVGVVMSWLDTPASRHTLDEDTLREQEDGSSGSALDETLDEQDQEMTGTPGSVVPGVSDAGMEGPAMVDARGVTTLEEPTVTLGPGLSDDGEADVSTFAEDASPDELVPEAGDADPGSAAERAARAGVEPPRQPDEINIADSAFAGDDETASDSVADSAEGATSANLATASDVETAEDAASPTPERQPTVTASETPQPSPATPHGTDREMRQSLSRAPRQEPPRRQPRAPGDTARGRNGAGRGSASGHGGRGGGRKHSARKDSK